MKALSFSLLALLAAALPAVASPAGTDKLLENQKGSVSYQAGGSGAARALAPKATIALNDSDVAQTGSNSLAAVALPDSSRILIGQNSQVTMSSFNQSSIATAKFVLVGKARFKVEHPAGAAANYTFSTSTGQIAVRGTEGDISAQPNGLQVNVYSLSNPALPVQVTLVNGQVYTLGAGQSLVVTATGAALSASTAALSHTLVTPFSEFGATPATSVAGAAAAAGAAGGAASAAVIGGAAAAAAAADIIGNSGTKTNPTPAPPTPAPGPATTSVPITVQGVPRGPHMGPPMPAMPTPHA